MTFAQFGPPETVNYSASSNNAAATCSDTQLTQFTAQPKQTDTPELRRDRPATPFHDASRSPCRGHELDSACPAGQLSRGGDGRLQPDPALVSRISTASTLPDRSAVGRHIDRSQKVAPETHSSTRQVLKPLGGLG